MLHILDEIAESNRIAMQNKLDHRIREGCIVKGHWRDYGSHRVWIDEHVRFAHKVVKLKRA